MSTISTLSAVGAGTPSERRGSWNLSIYGTFTGSIRIERSFDGGVTWLPITDAAGAVLAFTAPCSLVCYEPELGVSYRPYATALSAGAASVRMSA